MLFANIFREKESEKFPQKDKRPIHGKYHQNVKKKENLIKILKDLRILENVYAIRVVKDQHPSIIWPCQTNRMYLSFLDGLLIHVYIFVNNILSAAQKK